MSTPSAIDLNSRDSIKTLDQANMMSSIESLALQLKHAWEDTQNLTFNPTAEIRNLVVVGMGGSGLGADVIKSVFKQSLKIPLDIVHDYTLPGYVDSHTLVILSSYSGSTQEIITAAQSASDKQAQIMAICSGGKLWTLAEKNHWPVYKITPTYNPSNQPRMAIGYSVLGIVSLCAKAGIISVAMSDIDQVTATLADVVADNTVEVETDHNPAKMLAYQVYDKRTVLLGADFLEGALHVATNQSNENAKSFTGYCVIPEINHHILESLRFPSSLKETHIFIFFNSDLNYPENQKRVRLTQEIFEEHSLECVSLNLKGPTHLAQSFELINFMSFVSLYLAMLEGINPSPIPDVESFKQKLK